MKIFLCLALAIISVVTHAETASEASKFFDEFKAMPEAPAIAQSRFRGQLRPINHTVLSAGVDARVMAS